MSESNVHSQVDKAKNISERLDSLITRVLELTSVRDYGIDILMLLSNLNRSIIERIKRNQIALDTFYKLQNARKL
jgi:hypothetical protein